jgi:hypothetical protein
VNELVSLKPSFNAISVTEAAGFASRVLACSAIVVDRRLADRLFECGQK